MPQKYLSRWEWGKPELYQIEVEEKPKSYTVLHCEPVEGFTQRFFSRVLRKADLGVVQYGRGQATAQVFTTLSDALVWLMEQAEDHAEQLAADTAAAWQQRHSLARMLAEITEAPRRSLD